MNATVLKGLLLLGLLTVICLPLYSILSSHLSPEHQAQVEESRRSYFVIDCSMRRTYKSCQEDSFKLYPKAAAK